MRVTVSDISKIVSEAIGKNHLVGTVSGAGKDAIRGVRQSRATQVGVAARGASPGAERSIGRWARAAVTGKLDRDADKQASWTNGDSARSITIGNKFARMMRDAVMSAIQNHTAAKNTPSHFLTALELETIKKMTLQELIDVIDDSPSASKIADDVAKWAKRNS